MKQGVNTQGAYTCLAVAGWSFKTDTRGTKPLTREGESADLGAQTRKLLMMAVAGASRRLAVADAPQQLPALLRIQPRRIWIAQVHHWAAPLTLLDHLPQLEAPIGISATTYSNHFPCSYSWEQSARGVRSQWPGGICHVPSA